LVYRPQAKLIRTLILKNDRVYSVESKKRHLSERTIMRECEQGIIVSVGVSRIGKGIVVFVDSGAKINSEYTIVNMFSNEARCLSFKRRVVVITGLYSKTELLITQTEIQ